MNITRFGPTESIVGYLRHSRPMTWVCGRRKASLNVALAGCAKQARRVLRTRIGDSPRFRGQRLAELRTPIATIRAGRQASLDPSGPDESAPRATPR